MTIEKTIIDKPTNIPNVRELLKGNKLKISGLKASTTIKEKYNNNNRELRV
tara:strand:+ start:81 stop:233 length:153 start_codon:yes stop_codon:yes gene_type:complete